MSALSLSLKWTDNISLYQTFAAHCYYVDSSFNVCTLRRSWKYTVISTRKSCTGCWWTFCTKSTSGESQRQNSAKLPFNYASNDVQTKRANCPRWIKSAGINTYKNWGCENFRSHTVPYRTPQSRCMGDVCVDSRARLKFCRKSYRPIWGFSPFIWVFSLLPSTSEF